MTNDYLIFIGSGEASKVERKVLIWSLVINGKIPKDKIRVFNGTHDTLEDADGNILKKLDLDLFWKYKNVTEFSLYRFLIPSLMDYKGYGIWMDSDVLCLNDNIHQLLKFHQDNSGFDLACVTDAYPHMGQEFCALSVMNINCATSSFNLDAFKEKIQLGTLTYNDINLHSKNFLEQFPTNIGSISSKFNSFDKIDYQTCLVHYTDLSTQPWKSHWHSFGGVWHSSLQKAVSDSFLTEADIELSISRNYIRANIYDGNIPRARTLWRVAHRIMRFYING